jgi:hypothetical protein
MNGPASSFLVVPVHSTPLVSPSVEVDYRASSQASKQTGLSDSNPLPSRAKRSNST